MAKKPSLADALQKASGQTPKQINVDSNKIDLEESQNKYSRPSREGKKAVIGYFDPAVSKQLKQIALDEEISIQELLREAINDLFAKRGKASIA